jgi:hypothetical protein
MEMLKQMCVHPMGPRRGRLTALCWVKRQLMGKEFKQSPKGAINRLEPKSEVREAESVWETENKSSEPSILTGSTLTNSTKLGLKIFEKKLHLY